MLFMLLVFSLIDMVYETYWYALDCSTVGCLFGEGCHFLHYVPGGYNVVAQMMNLGPTMTSIARNVPAPPLVIHNGYASSAIKRCFC